MLLFDRIFCDECSAYMGQVFGSLASFDKLPDLPLCICPDCQAYLVDAPTSNTNFEPSALAERLS